MMASSAQVIAEALGGQRSGDGWIAPCPAHDDGKPSLSISEKDSKTLFYCHAGCSQEAVIEALRVRGLWDAEKPKGVTLADYALRKRLPIEFLAELGLREISLFGAPAIRIPYFDRDGEERSVRFRLRLEKGTHADGRFQWKKGSKLLLYGLHKLDRNAEHVIIVEGESDCQTAWLHGFNVVGVPGAASWNDKRDANHLLGFDVIYVVIEPDDGGKAFQERIAKSILREKVRFVTVPGGDLSALHCTNPDEFKATLGKALTDAEPWKETQREENEARALTALQACRELAQAPDILTRFLEDLHRLHVVGEDNNAKLLFLAITSRLLPKIVSAVLKGISSGGKSKTLLSTLKFFPETAYYVATSMSERWLAYTEESFQHRMLVILEAPGIHGEFLNMIIRTLLSENIIRYPTIEKSKDGLKERICVTEGPTGLLMSTTAVKIHHENETRLLSLPVDDSQEQTKRVFRAIAAERRHQTKADFSCYHALQEWLSLQDNRVEIPYIEALAESVPPIAGRLRRDFGTVITLIEAHTVLHQASRQRNDSGRIVATLEDYRVVRELVDPIVSAGVGATIPERVRRVVKGVENMINLRMSTTLQKTKDDAVEYVTIAQLAKHLKLDRSTVTRRVAEAIDLELLVNEQRQKGKPGMIAMGSHHIEDFDEKTLLPDPETLIGGGGGYTPDPTHTPHTPHTPADESEGVPGVPPVPGGGGIGPPPPGTGEWTYEPGATG